MKKNPSLLHICSYSWETGGPASFIFNHAKYQISQGVQIDIASAMYAWQTPYEVPKGATLFPFKKSILSRILSEFSWSLIFWFLKNRNRYDIIHVHGLWHFGSILPFIIPSRAQKVVTIHGFLDPYVFQKSGLVKKIFWLLFQKSFLRRADKLHAMNEEEYEYLLKLFPEKKNQIAFIGNGIEDPLKQTYNSTNPELISKVEQFLGDSELVFLFLSRKSAKKGLDILLESFAAAGRELNWNARLLIAGPDDDYSPSLKLFLSMYEGKDILELPLVLGAEKDYLYKICHLVVLPSYSEGFSIAALEAIAYGKLAILSNRVGFANELIQSNAAIIIEPTFENIKEVFLSISDLKTLEFDYQNNARNLYLKQYQYLDISKKFFKFISM